MAVPRKMAANKLEILKGAFDQQVQYVAKLDPAVVIDPLPQGRCVHVDPTSGKFKTGVKTVLTTAKQIFMPLWILQYSDDYDVVNDGGITGNHTADSASPDAIGGWMGLTPSRNITAVAAAGAYELQTTEFLVDGGANAEANYKPNTALTSVNADNDAAAGGLLSIGTPYLNPIVGIVSRPVAANAHKRKVVSFWPYVLPPSTTS